MDKRPAPVSGPHSQVSREPKFVFAFAVLLAFQCLGELVVRITHAPIPGPVVGMVVFVLALSTFPALARLLDDLSRSLLSHLSLLSYPPASA